jgi:hypothetical protein
VTAERLPDLVLEPGLPVRIVREHDWCADRLGWVLDVDGDIALVAFAGSAVAPRWYHAADLADERVRRTEVVIGAGREFLATLDAIARGQVTRDATIRILLTLRASVAALEQLETEARTWAGRADRA